VKRRNTLHPILETILGLFIGAAAIYSLIPGPVNRWVAGQWAEIIENGTDWLP
jgi:hypothetical protein